MKLIDKLAWIHLQDKRILSVRSHGKERFYMPGGKREENESDAEALIREIKEELMVDLIPETLKFADIFEAPADGRAEGVTVRLTCYFGEYTGNLQPSSEIAEFAWLTYDDKDKISAANLLVFDWLEEKGLLS
ncbi:MAG: NUDIX domain-containing protein [Chloroflexota bacterium]